MRATTFEFRYRFVILGLIYWAGFSCYAFDPVQAARWLAEHLAGNLAAAPGWHELRALLAAAALLTVAAAGLRTWASAYLHSVVVHDAALHSEHLVADGPFRFVRNPLYLGGMMLAIGFGAFASRSGFWVIVLAHWIFYSRLIGREEAELDRSQGDRFRAYRAAVPRLWPAARPRLPAGGAPPQWGQAWLGETFLWIFAIAAVAYASTLSERLFFWIVGISLASYPITLRVWRRQASARGAATPSERFKPGQ